MVDTTRDLVRRRANNRCEYCLLPQEHSELTHHVEHIVSKQHGGRDDMGNLALACHRCNLHKGPNLTGIDPLTGEVVSLFNPRHERWNEHFSFHGTHIMGITPTGRATVHVLAMNDPRRPGLRSEILVRNQF
jgi:hypothetical protein